MKGKLGMFAAKTAGGVFGGLTRPNGWTPGPDFTETYRRNGSIQFNGNFLTANTTVKVQRNELLVQVKLASLNFSYGGVRLLRNGVQEVQIIDQQFEFDYSNYGGSVGKIPNVFNLDDVITIERVIYDGTTYTLDTNGLVTLAYVALQMI